VKQFEGLFGDPAGSTNLAEGDLRYVQRRAERMAQRGVQPSGFAGIRARASDQAELAREISAALRARDVVRAQSLIQEGAAVFGHDAMLAAVELQAGQDRMQAMEAAGEPYHRVDDAWAEEPYSLEDERSEDERW
jgi:hypothetical protein